MFENSTKLWSFCYDLNVFSLNFTCW
jgi:hypothetical protein